MVCTVVIIRHHTSAGVLFPPEYVPHNLPVLYDGEEIQLSPEAEEVATMYAGMVEVCVINV